MRLKHKLELLGCYTVRSYLRGATIIRFLQPQISKISEEIAAIDSLKRKVQELEDWVSDL